MDLSRMYRIAETGDVNDPTPVDNVLRMAEERQRQQQQARPQSAWGRFENFAGSNAGRTLWGGLGAGLGVALTGGNLQDALGYGVIGAGNTVGTLNQNRQYANRLALKQQERADALAKEQRDRDLRPICLTGKLKRRKKRQTRHLSEHCSNWQSIISMQTKEPIWRGSGRLKIGMFIDSPTYSRLLWRIWAQNLSLSALYTPVP